MTLRPVHADRNASPTPPAAWPDATGTPWAEGAPHAGFLDGATITMEAGRRSLSVRIGLWLDDTGSVRRARWRAVKDPSLRACAEAACVLLESGVAPIDVDAASVRRLSATAIDPECAEMVAAAVQAGARISAR